VIARASRFELRRCWPLLMLGCWLGLLSGMIEAVVLLAPKLWTSRFVHLGRDVVWMAPVSEAAWLTAAAAVCGCGAALIGREWAHRAALRVLLLLAAATVWLSFSSLHVYSVVLLSLGSGMQLWRLVLPGQSGTARVVRVTLPWIAATLVAAACAVTFGPAALASPPPAAKGVARHPNVVLVTLDTVSAAHLSLYGYPRPTTPYLQELAKDSTVFERAVAPTSWTLPSHASMFTGRYPHELSASWDAPLDDRWPTLAEVLGDSGYRTAGFVANTIYCSYEHGLDRGFQRFDDFTVTPGQFVVSSAFGRKLSTRGRIRRAIGFYDVPGRKTAAQVNGEFLSWVGRNASTPFFAWLNYYDAHEPYLPPDPFRSRFERGHARQLRCLEHRLGSAERNTACTTSVDEVLAEVDAYDAAIALLDAQLRDLVTQLRTRGLLENTLLIVTADHGEEFGEHGLFSHGNSLYMPVIGVPLLIRYPHSVPVGRRISEVVSIRHMAATILDLTANEAALPGTPLRVTWTGEAQSLPPAALSELTKNDGARSEMYSLVTGQAHYIRAGGVQEELFDVRPGPVDAVRIPEQETSPATLESFRRMLAQRMSHAASTPGNALSETRSAGD
jgi:arylsulfatase A-like enzyme